MAEKVAEGIRLRAEAVVLPVGEATPEELTDADFLVVGGPTHMHGLSTSKSRQVAEADAEKRRPRPRPGRGERGLAHLVPHPRAGDGRPSAAFDTRLDGVAGFTGRASRGIARRLRHHGFELAVDPESFLVDKENHLVCGEGDRAREWAAALWGASSERNLEQPATARIDTAAKVLPIKRRPSEHGAGLRGCLPVRGPVLRAREDRPLDAHAGLSFASHMGPVDRWFCQ